MNHGSTRLQKNPASQTTMAKHSPNDTGDHCSYDDTPSLSLSLSLYLSIYLSCMCIAAFILFVIILILIKPRNTCLPRCNVSSSIYLRIHSGAHIHVDWPASKEWKYDGIGFRTESIIGFIIHRFQTMNTRWIMDKKKL